MEQARWRNAHIERGKPRVYIQQFLEVRLPEADYLQKLESIKGSRPSDPFDDDTGILVLEAFLEDLDDGSQCDSAHLNRTEGWVQLLTVVSYPYKQDTFDRLRSEFLARKLVAPGAESSKGEDADE